MKRGDCIKIPIKSKRQAVADFLTELNQILYDINFSPESNFFFNSKEKSGDDIRYSTPYTLLDLGYDADDVIETLKELMVEEYSETLYDRNNSNPPHLFVFGKQIKGRTIYIKLKVRKSEKVICVSFHYAKDKMNYPYK